MKANKQSEEERKPDLNETTDQQAIEDRVAAMMETEKSLASPRPNTDKSITAPELPPDPSGTNLDSKEVVSETAPKQLTTAIEEVNRQLMQEVDAPLGDRAVEEPAEASSSLVGGNPSPFDDPETDKVVDEIIAEESNELLSLKDEKTANAFKPEPKTSVKDKILAVLRNKTVRKIAAISSLSALFLTIVIPPSRYYVLNTAGVRSSASLVVVDASTQQPLKNVAVSLGGSNATTDDNGTVRLKKLRLGRNSLIITKRAFAPIEQTVTIGWGSNPLQDFSMTPIGSQYSFRVMDFLSGKPVKKAAAVSKYADAFSDDQGKIKLTIDEQEATEQEVTISAEGYREEKLVLNLDIKDEIVLQMVPDRKHVFVSKRSGKLDVYKVDVDGKNEKVILPATGSERDDMVIIPHPTSKLVAVVSTRENKRNADGFLLSTLTIIDLDTDTTRSVAESERVQIVDWLDDRLVYVQVASGESAASPTRHRLMSYHHDSEDNKELAKSNYFNDVMAVSGRIFYAPSSAYSDQPSVLTSIKSDGSDSKQVFDQEVWNIFRLSHDKLTLALQQQWFEYELGSTDKPAKINEPSNLNSRIYVDSPDKKRSLWVDNRDGKGVLLVYDQDKKEDVILKTEGGLKNPARWLDNDVVIYRINTQSETSDYVLSLDGGEPRKIRDVTNTGGVDQWYYY